MAAVAHPPPATHRTHVPTTSKSSSAHSPLPPTPSPPRPKNPHKKGQTRFEKEQAATGGKSAAEQPGDPKIIGPWRIGKTIGKGASGRVKIAKHNKTGQFAAIKIIPKHVLLMASRTSISEAAGKHDKAILGIEREIVIMKLIDHPNIMSLFDVWETSKELFLVLEYVEGGELFDYLVSQGRLHPDEASRYFQQIIAGVDYCHRFNICHRDLKPENLLLDADRNIKIADFGMAALEPSGRLLETSCGSPHYASPEIVMGLSYHGAASDIWSCGVILYALLTGRLPFDDENIRVLLQKVKNGRFSIPPDLPADARDLIARMLVVHPERRITMPEIMIHPFFQRRHASDSARAIRSIDPPKLELVDRPVRYEWEIDRDILRNLRTLWSGTSDNQMIRALLSPEKNMEKSFYFLLQQYRNKNLENYNAEAESPDPGSAPAFPDNQYPGAHTITHGDTPVPHDMPVRRVWSGVGGSEVMSGSSVTGSKDSGSHRVKSRDRTRDGDKDRERERERERRRKDREKEKERERENNQGSTTHRRTSRRASVSGVVTTKKQPTRIVEAGGKTASRPAPAAPGPTKSPQTPSRRSVLGPRPPTNQTPTSGHSPRVPRASGVENMPSQRPSPSTAGESKVEHKSTIRLVQPRTTTSSYAENEGPMTPPHPLQHRQVTSIAERVPQITVQIPTPQNDPGSTHNSSSAASTPTPTPTPSLGQTDAVTGTGLGIVLPTAPYAHGTSSQSHQQSALPATPSPTPRIGGPDKINSNTSPSSPPLGSISVPQVQDAALQKFFHDIAEQLQLIGGASPRSSIALEHGNGQGNDANGQSQAQRQIQTRLPLQMPALIRDEPAGSASANTSSANTPLVTPLLDAPAQYTGTDKERYPRAPAAGKSKEAVEYEQEIVQRPIPVRAMTEVVTSPAVNGSAKVAMKRRSYVEEGTASPFVNVKGTGYHNKVEIPDVQPRRYSKQKVEIGGRRVSQKSSEMKRKMKPAPLDLSPRVIQQDQLLSPLNTPHLGGYNPSGAHSAPSSPLTIGPSHDGKQSWFSNLFSWKPAMFTLISADDCASSRAECVKLLESFGAVVVLEDADGWGVLKCKIEEIRDVSGIIIPKSVRFRIEFLPHSSHVSATPRIAHERYASGISSHGPVRSSGVGSGGVVHATSLGSSAPNSPVPPLSPGSNSGPSASAAPRSPRSRPASSIITTTTSPAVTGNAGIESGSGAGTGITTSMTMIQEKGALSAFKAVYGRIRSEWRLDSLKSPALGSGSRMGGNGMGTAGNTPQGSPLPSPAIDQAGW